MRTQTAKIIPYKRENVQEFPYVYQKKAPAYDFAMSKKKLRLLIALTSALIILFFVAGLIVGLMKSTSPLVNEKSAETPVVQKSKSVKLHEMVVVAEPEIIVSDTEQLLRKVIDLSIRKSGGKSSQQLFFSLFDKGFWNKKDANGLIVSSLKPSKELDKLLQKKPFALVLEVFPDRKQADNRVSELGEKGYKPYILEAFDNNGKKCSVLVLDDYEGIEKVSSAGFEFKLKERKTGLLAFMDAGIPLRHLSSTWGDDEPRPYTLKLASYRNKQDADKGFEKYASKGLSPYMVKVYLGKKGGYSWVVYTGPYRTKKEAVISKKQIPKSVVKNRGPYANYIESFEDEQDAGKMCEKLLKLHYSPYIEKKEDPLYKVFVGAHKNRKGAEQQNLKLKKDGVESRVVIR